MVKRILSLLLVAFLLADCNRGDWTVELHSGYLIDQINSSHIMIGHRDDPNDSWFSTVITHYFVTAFWEDERYIAVEGIPMQEEFHISDAERKSEMRSFYLVDAVTSKIEGPFEKDEFWEYGEKLGLDFSEGWVYTADIRA